MRGEMELESLLSAIEVRIAAFVALCLAGFC
jgi:hypothetical protein